MQLPNGRLDHRGKGLSNRESEGAGDQLWTTPNPRKRQREKKYIGFSPDISSSIAKTAGSPMSEEMSFTGVRNLGHCVEKGESGGKYGGK